MNTTAFAALALKASGSAPKALRGAGRWIARAGQRRRRLQLRRQGRAVGDRRHRRGGPGPRGRRPQADHDRQARRRVPRAPPERRRRLPARAGRRLQRAVDGVGGPGAARRRARPGQGAPLARPARLPALAHVALGRGPLLAHQPPDAGLGDRAGRDGAGPQAAAAEAGRPREARPGRPPPRPRTHHDAERKKGARHRSCAAAAAGDRGGRAAARRKKGVRHRSLRLPRRRSRRTAPIARASSPGWPRTPSCEELHDATDLPSRIGSRPRESRCPQGDGRRRAPRRALARRRAAPGQGPRGGRRGRRRRGRPARPTPSSRRPAPRSATRGAPTWSPRSPPRPRPRRRARQGLGADRLPRPAHQRPGHQGDRRHRRHELRDGGDPAHQPRAVDGRALQPGDRRGLQGRADRRGRAGPLLPDADDRRGHDPARPGARARRRRGRPAGDRDRPAASARS